MTEEPPKPEYERFDGETDFQKAVDRLLEQQGRELRIFDPDLSSLRLNLPARIAQLERFLRASRTRRIYIAVEAFVFRLGRFVGHVFRSRRRYPELCHSRIRRSSPARESNAPDARRRSANAASARRCAARGTSSSPLMKNRTPR